MTVSPCLDFALQIQLHVEPREWPAALEKVPAPCREECETYLRGIATRMRAQRAAKAELEREKHRRAMGWRR